MLSPGLLFLIILNIYYYYASKGFVSNFIIVISLFLFGIALPYFT